MKETIVLYPAPELSHLVSLVELGKLITHHHGHRFSVTVLLPSAESFHIGAFDSYIDSVSQTHPSIVFHRFPALPQLESSVSTTMFQTIRRNNPNLVDSLQTISNSSSIAALVVDFFCNLATPIVADLNIPLYNYMPTGASGLSIMLYLPKIHNQTEKSLKELGNTVLNIPGLPPICATQMPQPFQERNNEIYQGMLEIAINLTNSRGIISNTFEAIEPRVIQAVKEQSPGLFCIGPLVAEPSDKYSESECLKWLDQQPNRSVVFLSFGSRGVFPMKQIAEIADGLERSGHRFLWVVRNPPPESDKRSSVSAATDDFHLDDVMPDGFLDRTRNRGLVVKSWAPQVEVLSRESVGAFVTHCGWNSILESVCAGVPMLAWPLYAEQEVNKEFLVKEVKLAMPMEVAEDGIVVADEVEKRVRALMDSAEGTEMRERCKELKEKALAAWAKDGPSKTSFTDLAESWERK